MRKSLLIIFAIGSINANAQGIGEWFNQKKTQIKYYVQQIAAYEIYLDYLKKGYNICQGGLNTIGDIKDNNFNDHKTYFSSLKIGKNFDRDCVKNAPRSRAQIENQLTVLKNDCVQSGMLTAPELVYIDKVRGNLLTLCDVDIAEVKNMVTNGGVQMTDDERIDRMSLVCGRLQDKFAFCKSFCNSMRLLIIQRKGDRTEVEKSKSFID